MLPQLQQTNQHDPQKQLATSHAPARTEANTTPQSEKSLPSQAAKATQASIPTNPSIHAEPSTPQASAQTSVEREAKIVPLVNDSVKRFDPNKIYQEPLPLAGPREFTGSQQQFNHDLLRYTIRQGNWPAYHQLLQHSLVESISQQQLGRGSQRYQALWNQPNLDAALLRWKLLGTFSASLWSQIAQQPGGEEFLENLLLTPAWQEEILLTLRPEDDQELVLNFLLEAWQSHQGDHAKAIRYFNLALGCAVVFDQPLALNRPTSAGGQVNGIERYHWYIKQNESGLTKAPIDRTSARDLAFVVCSPVSTEELEWAAKKLRSLRRAKWGEAFSMVEYLMERAINGLNPYPDYTLPQILKHGGICGDQTYFCVNTARAVGIPAFGLSGITDSGGHAWASVKIKPDEWSTDIGRISGVSKGTGHDPQTGEKIAEQDVWQWNHRKYQNTKLWAKVQRHFWLADLLGNHDEAYLAVETGWKLAPEFPEIWHAVYQSMHQRSLSDAPSLAPTKEEWQKFTEDLRREFRKNPRMATLANEIEETQLFPLLDLSSIRRQLARERRRIEREASEQNDLLIDLVEREKSWISKHLDDTEATNEITRLYKKSLRDYGSSITGFRSLAEAYFAYCKKHPELANDAVSDISSAFDRQIKTGSGDYFRAKTEADLHRFIAQLYRQIGETQKAERIEKRIEKDMERIQRKSL